MPVDKQGEAIPKRICVANICQWVYRSSECSYTGTSFFDFNDSPVGSAAQDVCGKRLTSCKARFPDFVALPFGGFPSLGMLQ
jgi:lambda family phage minor tail protein L